MVARPGMHLDRANSQTRNLDFHRTPVLSPCLTSYSSLLILIPLRLIFFMRLRPFAFDESNYRAYFLIRQFSSETHHIALISRHNGGYPKFRNLENQIG